MIYRLVEILLFEKIKVKAKTIEFLSYMLLSIASHTADTLVFAFETKEEEEKPNKRTKLAHQVLVLRRRKCARRVDNTRGRSGGGDGKTPTISLLYKQ